VAGAIDVRFRNAGPPALAEAGVAEIIVDNRLASAGSAAASFGLPAAGGL
jgi:hypothetical protein